MIRWTRRELGVVGLGVLLAACTSPSEQPPAASTAPGSSSPSPIPTVGTPPPTPPPPPVAPSVLPAAVRWAPSSSEVQSEVKLAATRAVEVAGAWPAGSDRPGGTEAAMAARLSAAGLAPEVSRDLVELQSADAVEAVTQVVQPQFGGLTPIDASVIVRVTQTLVPADDPAVRITREAVLDVRLVLGPTGTWVVTAIGAPRSLGSPLRPTDLAELDLANPQLLLPEPAREDIGTGRVDARVLAILDALSRNHLVEVQTITTGHHGLVWGTPRTSNHAVGRAVDVWRIDGVPVVDADEAAVRAFMIEAAAAGATEVGGPVVIVGQGFFTDAVHSDHVHVGVSLQKPQASPAP